MSLNVGSIRSSKLVFFGWVVFSDLYLFQEIVLLNPYLIISKILIFSLTGKVTTGTETLALCTWNVALYAEVVTSYLTGLVFGTALDVLDVSDITQYLDCGKSSSISQLINDKSRALQKLLNYFNGTKTSASNLPPLLGVLPFNFVLNSKNLLLVSLLFILKLFSPLFS